MAPPAEGCVGCTWISPTPRRQFLRLPERSVTGPRSPQAAMNGAATSSGIEFQQQLGALIAARMVADRTLDCLFETAGARADWLGFETSAPVDDIMIGTSEDGIIAIQAKTTVSLSQQPDSPFAEVIDQFVRHWLVCRDGNGKRQWDRPLNPGTDRLVLAVKPGAPKTVRCDFPKALRAHTPKPILDLSDLSDSQSWASECFEACVRHAWQKHASQEPFPEERLLQELARLITVASFDTEGTGRAAVVKTHGAANPESG